MCGAVVVSLFVVVVVGGGGREFRSTQPTKTEDARPRKCTANHEPVPKKARRAATSSLKKMRES